jgi:LSD1 subclass zinc finger protein
MSREPTPRRKRNRFEKLAKYTPESHRVRCSVCGSEAVVEIMGVEISVWGGHWMRAPKGWWIAIGITVQEIARGGAGGVRCPKCFHAAEVFDHD